MMSRFDTEIKLHRKQMKVWRDRARFVSVVAGRRSGKTRYGGQRTLTKAMEYQGSYDPLSPPTVLALFPTLKQGRGVFWLPLLNLLTQEPWCHAVQDISKTDYRVRFKGNKPDLIVRGANDGADNLRGLKLWYCWTDEAQDIHGDVYELVLLPALSDMEGGLLKTLTPKGPLGHAYEDFQRGLNPKFPEWSAHRFRFIDNQFLPFRHREYRRAKLMLPARAVKQEYDADFMSFGGQIYDALTEDHLSERHDPIHSLLLGHDPGDLNPALVLIGFNRDYHTYYILEAWQPGDGSMSVAESDVDAQIIGWIHKYQRLPLKRVRIDPSRPLVKTRLRRLGRQINEPGLGKTLGGINALVEGNSLMNTLYRQRRLTIHPRCRHFFNQAIAYTRKRRSDGEFEDVPDGNHYHMTDAARYIVATTEVELIRSHSRKYKQMSDRDVLRDAAAMIHEIARSA